jgi:hypothetical protein
MINTTTRRWTTVATVISVLIVAETVSFLLASLLHLGVQLPLGFLEPRVIPAAIVEGLCGISLAVSAYAVFARKTWAWRGAVAAHVFAVAGVFLGITAVALGGDPDDPANTIFHWVIVAVLILVLALLATPGARITLSRGNQTLL